MVKVSIIFCWYVTYSILPSIWRCVNGVYLSYSRSQYPGRGRMDCKSYLYPKFHNLVILTVSKPLWLLFKISIGWFQTNSVETFHPKILNCRKGNFVYYHMRCIYTYISFYLLISYPMISMLGTKGWLGAQQLVLKM